MSEPNSKDPAFWGAKKAKPKSYPFTVCDIDGRDEHAVACPVCSYSNTHHRSQTVIIDGDDNYKAAPQHCRGDVIHIPFYCENGHNFLVRFGFHKGQVLVWAEADGSMDADWLKQNQ